MSLQSDETQDFVKELTKHQSSLRAFIVSLIPGSSDVEDVLQDTNVVLWKKMEEFTPDTNFTAWAFAIARNTVKAQHRKNKRNQAPALNDEIILAVCETWYQRDPAVSNKNLIALEECMKSLSDTNRSIVAARYTKGTNLEEHSDKTGRSAKSLRVTLFRIRTKLRECVQGRVAQEGGAH